MFTGRVSNSCAETGDLNGWLSPVAIEGALNSALNVPSFVEVVLFLDHPLPEALHSSLWTILCHTAGTDAQGQVLNASIFPGVSV